MVNKKKISKTGVAATAVATFGVAMTSVYLSPEIQADILDITWNGGNATATNPFFNGSGLPVTFDMDQVPNVAAAAGDFAQWNDTFGGTGRTLNISAAGVIGNLLSHANVASGDVLSPATFAGTFSPLGGGVTGTGYGTFDGSGTAFVGFRTAANNVGWYQMTFAPVSPIVYSSGQVGSMGESVTVGGGTTGCANPLGDVNLDGVVTLLDVSPFVALLTGGGFQCEADINEDGVVSLLDVNPFVQILTGG